MAVDIKPILRIAKVEDALHAGLKEQEFRSILELLGREISILEVGIFSALYSEHCSYKSTRVHLKGLMTSGDRVIQGPGENAGIVDIGDGFGVAFKVESHNHPSFIEPFQGAATGVGGILRDVFTMNARPLALMNALRFGEPSNARTPYLLSRAVAGIGHYGNCVGVPTVRGELFFHESYNGNCLVNAFALGLVENSKIFLGQASGVGNPIFYVGSKTGRDGIHGATMASEEFGDDSAEKRPTVQVGDPFQEKLLIEACLEAMASGAVVGIQDMGAAGMTSSSYEMAARAGNGIRLDLDRVPQREEGMNPYEIMLSESQERMLVIAGQGREAELKAIFERWGLDVVQVGKVVGGPNVDLFWHGEVVSTLPYDVLVDRAPQYRWPEQEPTDYRSKIEFPVEQISAPEDLEAVWLDLLGSPNSCSRYAVFRQYDSTVRGNTVVHPGGDAAVIRIKSEQKPEKGVAVTIDCNSRFCGIDPRRGTALSVVEAMRNLAAVGAEPIGISDCLNFGSPERPEGMWQIAESIRGLNEASRALGVPVVSGNVSLYNENKGVGILPTPMIAMVGLMPDASRAIGAQFVADGDVVFVVGECFEEFGGSEYLASLAGIEKGALPALDYDLEKRTADFVRRMISSGTLRSCHDISQGGLAIALTECCLGVYGARGVTLAVTAPALVRGGEESRRKDALLFSETGARYIVSVSPQDDTAFRRELAVHGLSITLAGQVAEIKLPLQAMRRLDSRQLASAGCMG
jgi:phosphoribosylformylglycinamidine synthase II